MSCPKDLRFHSGMKPHYCPDPDFLFLKIGIFTICRPRSYWMTSNLEIIFYSHFGNFRQAARNLFVNSVLKRVTTNNAKNLRRKTAQEFLTGNSAPFLALVGVRSDFSIKLTDSPRTDLRFCGGLTFMKVNQ